ncbi:Uncharacterised protein [Mycobacteroides abscessus subsp. massiliense]|nr:Uncharacterised protein [Mycobacteroides abscessus subsp. massiliense]
MAFCTDNVQTACGHNLVVFGLPTAFKGGNLRLFLLFAQGFIGTDGFDLMFEVAALVFFGIQNVMRQTCFV